MIITLKRAGFPALKCLWESGGGYKDQSLQTKDMYSIGPEGERWLAAVEVKNR